MESTASMQGKRCEMKQPGFRLVVVFAPDASSCVASYEPFEGGPPLSDAELQEFLKQTEITLGLCGEAVQEILLRAKCGKGIHVLTLAEGTAMIPGEDGRIAPKHSSPDEGEESDDGKGQIDFRDIVEFCNVQEGEVVATIVPPGEGTAGMSVYGTVIPPLAGKPAAVKLGKNVTLSEDGSEIIATAAGGVYCQGGEISIENVFQVAGDVDFKVGNLDFNGFVEVTGDVLDGFKVRASKGIKVLGNVGACAISSDGDISFCGMNGQGSGSVRCGGSLSANYIHEAKVEVANDIVVESEIRHCGIKCLGSIRVQKGGIVGGECVALAGVEAASIGSVASLHTRVVVGVSYHDLEELTQRFEELKDLTARQKLIQGSKAENDTSLQQRAAITALIRGIRARSYPRANAKLNIRKVLYAGVTVSLGALAEEFRDEQPGPFSMIENKIEGGVRFLDMTGLSVLASTLEEAFIRKAEMARG
jgi:uncharacterized protein